jgi:nicotinamidase-related amidase
MPELDLQADAVFYKKVHSALYAKTTNGVTLEDWLRSHGVEEVLVTGIRTEQCCETTTRHASDVGFKVRFVGDATLTFPMQSRNGRRFSAAEARAGRPICADRIDGRGACVN